MNIVISINRSVNIRIQVIILILILYFKGYSDLPEKIILNNSPSRPAWSSPVDIRLKTSLSWNMSSEPIKRI